MSLQFCSVYFKFLVSKTYLVICLLGLSYQVYLVSNIYFGYQVVTDVAVEIPEKNEPQAVTVCLQYDQVLDYEKAKKETGKSDLKYEGWYMKKQHLKTAQTTLTIDQIFKYSPEPREILQTVTYRKNYSYRLFHLNGTEVYRKFEVKKFLYLEYICFQIYKKNDSDQLMTYASLAVTPVWSGLIYDLIMSPRLSMASTLKIIINNRDTLPYRPLMVTPQVRRYYNDSGGKAKYNIFTVYQTRLSVHNMPPPYTTQCRNYQKEGFSSRTECIEKCVYNLILNMTGKVPFTYILTESVPQYMVSYKDIFNDSYAGDLFRVENFCSSSVCRQRGCYERTSSTRSHEQSGTAFTIRQILTTEPWIDIMSRESMNLVEYVTYVTSIISTYTGLSFLSLNPLSIFLLVKGYVTANLTEVNSERKPSSHLRGKAGRKASYEIGRNDNKSRPVTPIVSFDKITFKGQRGQSIRFLDQKIKRLEDTYDRILNHLFKRDNELN